MAPSVSQKTFLDLPLELRTRIYKMVFPRHTVTVDLHRTKLVSEQDKSTCAATPFARCAALLRTNRAIYREASPIFFDTLTVHFTRNLQINRCLKACTWAEGHPLASHVAHLNVEFDIWELDKLDYKEFTDFEMPNLKSVKLCCSAVHWVYGSQGDVSYDRTLTYDKIWLKLGIAAEAFRMKHKLRKKRDESLKGRRVVFEVC